MGGGAGAAIKPKRSSDNDSEGSSASYDDASESASSLRGSVKLPVVVNKTVKAPVKVESKVDANEKQELLDEIAEVELDIMRAKRKLTPELEMLILQMELESKERILNCIRKATKK